MSESDPPERKPSNLTKGRGNRGVLNTSNSSKNSKVSNIVPINVILSEN